MQGKGIEEKEEGWESERVRSFKLADERHHFATPLVRLLQDLVHIEVFDLFFCQQALETPHFQNRH